MKSLDKDAPDYYAAISWAWPWECFDFISWLWFSWNFINSDGYREAGGRVLGVELIQYWKIPDGELRF